MICTEDLLLQASQKNRQIGPSRQPPDAFGPRKSRETESELDSLVPVLKKHGVDGPRTAKSGGPERLQMLRKLMLEKLIPVFVELVEKYSEAGFAMQMDASNFLEGGREIRFEFGIGDYRTELLGTVTTEAIAFHETRFSPNVHGDLISGPMLRLHTLDSVTFRDFVCERLLVLARSRLRQR